MYWLLHIIILLGREVGDIILQSIEEKKWKKICITIQVCSLQEEKNEYATVI